MVASQLNVGSLRALRFGAARRALARRAVDHTAAFLRDRLAPASPEERLDDVTLLRNLVTKEAVGALVELGVPDRIAAGTRSVAALAAATGAHPDALRRVCRHLVARGILVEEAPGRVALSDAGELLRTDHPESRASFYAPYGAASRLEQAVSGLRHAVGTGSAAYAHVHGEELWRQVGDDPVVAASFDQEMSRHARAIGAALAERCDLARLGTVVDVGGGTGELLVELLHRFPELRGTIVEVGDAVTRAKRAVEHAAIAPRLRVVEADVRTALPAGADAYVLSWILHDWDDDQAAAILRSCAEAAPPGGRVLVVEQPFDVTPNTDLDLRMLVFFGGRERSRAEYEALATKAGLRRRSWTPLGDGFWVMDARRPEARRAARRHPSP